MDPTVTAKRTKLGSTEFSRIKGWLHTPRLAHVFE